MPRKTNRFVQEDRLNAAVESIHHAGLTHDRIDSLQGIAENNLRILWDHKEELTKFNERVEKLERRMIADSENRGGSELDNTVPYGGPDFLKYQQAQEPPKNLGNITFKQQVNQAHPNITTVEAAIIALEQWDKAISRGTYIRGLGVSTAIRFLREHMEKRLAGIK